MKKGLIKRVPRKHKKKYKKQGLIGAYFYSAKVHNSVIEMISFPNRRILTSLLTNDEK